MIVNNQGEMLDKIAESDDNLAQTIYEVKKVFLRATSSFLIRECL